LHLVASKPIANEREAKLRDIGCEFVSTFGVVPEASMTKDGVHPDAAGNAAMAKALLGRLVP
jgi:acyl-CoA thioesterase-1